MKSTIFRIKSLLLAVSLAAAASVSLAQPALAATCNGVNTSIDYGCDTGTDPAGSILLVAINFMAIGVGVAVVGGIVFGALRYSSANGNNAQAQQGITIIRNSIIGLIVFIFMYAILNFLLPGGAFRFNDPLPAAKPFGSSDSGITIPRDDGTWVRPPSGTGGIPSASGSACYNVNVTKADIATKDRFHRKSSQPYALENSFQGIDYAASHGYKGIDIDVMVSKDGVLVGSHAWEPLKSGITGGFKDPLGKIDKDARLSSLTLAELRRLEHKDGYKISTLEELIKYAKSKNINLIIEMKVPSKIESQLPHIADMLNENGVKAGITSRKDKAGYVQALKTARSLGFHTRMASSPGASAKDRTWVSPNKDEALCKRLNG